MPREQESLGEEDAAPGDTLDAVFAISCPSLPVDHAYSLSQAIQAALPWFAAEERAGLHLIYGAGSGSGWMRPEDPSALLHFSQRTRLMLRLPRHRLDDAAALLGRTLLVAGWPLRIDKMVPRRLSPITTLFSRCVVLAAEREETAFLSAAADELGARGIEPARMLCGRVTPIATPARTYQARSLMLAGLTLEHSLALQQNGLGIEHQLGCGLFIPHKDIAGLR